MDISRTKDSIKTKWWVTKWVIEWGIKEDLIWEIRWEIDLEKVLQVVSNSKEEISEKEK